MAISSVIVKNKKDPVANKRVTVSFGTSGGSQSTAFTNKNGVAEISHGYEGEVVIRIGERTFRGYSVPGTININLG